MDLSTIGVGLCALSVAGPAVGVGMVAWKTQEGIARQPEMKADLRANGIIFAAMCEGLGVIGLLLGLMMLFAK